MIHQSMDCQLTNGPNVGVKVYIQTKFIMSGKGGPELENGKLNVIPWNEYSIFSQRDSSCNTKSILILKYIYTFSYGFCALLQILV